MRVEEGESLENGGLDHEVYAACRYLISHRENLKDI